MVRRKLEGYFDRLKGAPLPVVVRLKKRVNFSEVDCLGIVWYGRFANYFEEGSAALGRACGLSYRDFRDAGLRAPIVQFHIDYHKPLVLDEEFTIETSLVWSDGSRLNIEYSLIKQDQSLAASGYTVQMLVDERTQEVCLVPPELLERCRERWKRDEFKCLR